MTFYSIEVKRPASGNGKNKIVGLHDSTDRALPEPVWGGNACFHVSEFTYNVLKACKGDIKALTTLVTSLNEWLEGEEVMS